MHRRSLLFFILALLLSPGSLRAQTGSPRRIGADIAYLAADAREGRGIGTAGLDAAAEYIARTFARIGLSQPFPDGYFQAFTIDSTAPVAAHMGIGGAAVKNVVGVLPGRGPLAGQVVVIGAHYDHLGFGGPNALDPDSTGVVHNGADDNASGTAVMLALAETMADYLAANAIGDRPRRSIMFQAYGSEELGLVGSQYFLRHPGFHIQDMAGMLCFDMVGRLRSDELFISGLWTSPQWPGVLEQYNPTDLDVIDKQDCQSCSDYSTFRRAGVPAVWFFTGFHDQYNSPEDDVALIHVPGLARIANMGAGALLQLAIRPVRVPFGKAVPNG